jgi:NAD(P)-dependent dehydrogenase (short-subunit alcohol dehydrogenase family)
MGCLDGKVALITGAGSGIGRQTALTFAREGAKVVVADRMSETGQETVRLAQGLGGEAIFVKVDVTKALEVQAMVRQTVEAYGRIDAAHNNAGVESLIMTTADCSEDNWDRVVGINLKGVWLCMKYEIPPMVDQGGGVIINTSSVVGLVGQRDIAPYVASKHGVIGLTKTAALENAQFGLRVNAVCPAIVSTPMLDRFTLGDPEIIADLVAMYPLGRLATPEDVAEAVVWLCSDAASYINGHALVVDGGFSAQ